MRAFAPTALALALTAAGCASAPAPAPSTTTPVTNAPAAPAPAPTCEAGDPSGALPAFTSAETFLTDHKTGLELYRRTGGAWLGELPVLVNEPFDFAIAMSMPNLGPAIAAGKRKKQNEDKAALLTKTTLSDELHQRLAALRACGVHAYAVLWGSAVESTLHVVVDRYEATPTPALHAVAESAPSPVSEWAVSGALSTAILAQLDSALSALAPIETKQP